MWIFFFLVASRYSLPYFAGRSAKKEVEWFVPHHTNWERSRTRSQFSCSSDWRLLTWTQPLWRSGRDAQSVAAPHFPLFLDVPHLGRLPSALFRTRLPLWIVTFKVGWSPLASEVSDSSPPLWLLWKFASVSLWCFWDGSSACLCPHRVVSAEWGFCSRNDDDIMACKWLLPTLPDLILARRHKFYPNIIGKEAGSEMKWLTQSYIVN